MQQQSSHHHYLQEPERSLLRRQQRSPQMVLLTTNQQLNQHHLLPQQEFLHQDQVLLQQLAFRLLVRLQRQRLDHRLIGLLQELANLLPRKNVHHLPDKQQQQRQELQVPQHPRYHDDLQAGR